MIAKWIVCRVSESHRSAFAAAQRLWSGMSGCNGFSGQFGGFCGEHAHIVGLWSQRELYDQFMSCRHDVIARENRQHEFYSHIHVSVLGKVMELPGECASLAEAVTSAVFARLAVREVHESNVEHFLAMQRDVWAPAMAKAPGMLGGACWSFEGQPSRFLVSSLWRSESEHGAYASGEVPRLRECAAVDQDIAQVQGRHFNLQQSWSIRPSIERKCSQTKGDVDHVDG
jgi:heme-degrading monooxygenase HmoA